jgi:hypothetical protein
MRIERFEGLYINKFTALQRPVQIVRQTISNLDMPISPYHRYKGLSSIPNLAGNKEGYTKPLYIQTILLGYMPDMRYKGLADMKV